VQAQLREQYPKVAISTMNGLAVMGSATHHVVRDGFQQQLRHARWSYRLVFRACDARLTCALLWRVLPRLYGRRMLDAINLHRPDLVISTYPLCTGVLGRLRSSGALDARLVALVTDVHPHRLWFAPGVDEHLVCTPGDVERAARLVPWAPVAAVRPPTSDRFDAAEARRMDARCDLGFELDAEITLISGGSWGVGSMARLVRTVDRPGHVTLVACGRNDRLREQVTAMRHRGEVQALGYTDRMHDYVHAADVVVATGAGLTVFEAIAAGVPVILASAIPGHGIRSAKALDADDLSTFAPRRRNLQRVIAAGTDDLVDRAYVVARRELLALPDVVASAVAAPATLAPPVRTTARRVGRRREVMRLARRSAVAALVLVSAAGHPPPVRAALAHADHAVHRSAHVVHAEAHELRMRHAVAADQKT
jgi:UDP-N-acetylglucosamine:LPS N-acetylglucosamine transferase